MFSLSDFHLASKTILVRVDYNVPLKNGKVTENYKIKASLPTIKFLLANDCKIILAAHLGRPEGKVVSSLKVDPLAEELKSLLPKVKIFKLNDCIGKEIKEEISQGKKKQIFLLENLRFYKEEEENDPAFAHSLAELADFYVNDAFGVSHRKHASVEAITHFIPSLPGLLLEKEIYHLQKVLKAERPSVWILGGAKLNKVELIRQAFQKADQILIGGALAFSFLKAKGYSVGMSKIDAESVQIAKHLLKSSSAKKIILPIDFVVTGKVAYHTKTEIVNCKEIASHQMALDLGPKTIELFKKILFKAKTVVWNGPLGYFESAQFAVGTKEIGRFLGKVKALKVAGGGETSEMIYKFQLEHNFSHVSTGGGAALTFLAGKPMPGLAALERNYQRYKHEKRF